MRCAADCRIGSCVEAAVPLASRIARDPNFSPIPEPESTKDNARAGRKKKTA